MRIRGRSAGLAALIAAGVLISAALLTLTAHPGPNDFAQFYSASKLLPGVNAYDFKLLAPAERALGTSPVPFLRPLWFPLLLRPLTMLPFATAVWLWRMLSVAACIGFVFIWPGPRLLTALALAWSYPLLVVLWSGQETALLLFGAGLTLWLIRRGHGLAAGIVLALLTVKFHVFVLVPLVLLRHRLWRVVAGAAIGLVALISASLLYWPGWVAAYAAALWTPEGAGNVVNMFNIYGMLSGNIPAVILLSAAALFACVTIVWHSDPTIGTGAAILAGILAGPHAYLYDALLCVPAGLAVATCSKSRWLRAAAVVVLAPFIYIAANVPGLVHAPVVAALAMLGGMALETRSGK
jgi:hypothetical protein